MSQFGKRYFTVKQCLNGSVTLISNIPSHESVCQSFLIAASYNVVVNCEAGRTFTGLNIRAQSPGVVCLGFRVATNHNRSKDGVTFAWHTMMLGVNGNGLRTEIDLDDPWAPVENRVGILDCHDSPGPGEIATVVNGVTYTNYGPGIEKRPNTKLVPYGNLIASFLTGDAPLSELERTATLYGEEIQARLQLPGLLATQERFETLAVRIAHALQDEFPNDLPCFPNNQCDALELWHAYRRRALLASDNNRLTLARLKIAIGDLARALKLGWLNPWRWSDLPIATRKVVQAAQESGLLREES